MKSLTTTLMEVRFTHLTMLGAIGVVSERVALRQYSEPLTVFTPNAEQLMQTKEDVSFLSILQSADVLIPDSVGLVYADWWKAALTGKPWMIRERVTGIDLAENLISTAAKQGWKVVLVGGIGTCAQIACERLKKRFSGLQIWWAPSSVDVAHESGVDFRETLQVLESIKPDLVFVGFGAPKQERWVMRHKQELSAQVVMVVGGAIDMWAGSSRRAPKIIQKMGLEWFWRLVHEPRRIKRQVRLLRFVRELFR